MEKTIGVYQTKKFQNKGVAGSKPVKSGDAHKAIGPNLNEFKLPTKNIAHNPVVEKAVGNGVDGQNPVGKFSGKKD